MWNCATNLSKTWIHSNIEYYHGHRCQLVMIYLDRYRSWLIRFPVAVPRCRWIVNESVARKKKKKTKRNTEGRRGHFYHGHYSYTAYVCEMLSEKHDRHPISLMSRKPALIERISNKRRQLRVTYFHCHDCREPRNVPPRYPFTSSLLFDTSDRWIVELIHRWRSTISSSNFLPLKILLLFSSLVRIKIIPILRIQ